MSPQKIQENLQIISEPQKILRFMQRRRILKLLKINLRQPLKKDNNLSSPKSLHKYKYPRDFQIEFLKKEIASNFYHLVVRYVIKTVHRKIGIIMTAHSYEKRLPSWRALKFLSLKGFNQGSLQTPKPLYYSKKLKAMFYREALGVNLRKLIRKKSKYAEKIIQESALWLSKLHSLPVKPEMNFNKINSSAFSITPGYKRGIAQIKKLAPSFALKIKKIWGQLIVAERRNFKQLSRKYLIHGDFHPENVIFNKQYPKKITVIDFTDICLSDFARDLGNFLEQLNFMSSRDKIKNQILKQWQEQFLHTYLKARNLVLDENLKNRLYLYRALTAFRTTIYYLTSGKYFNTKNAKTTLSIAEKWLERMNTEF